MIKSLTLEHFLIFYGFKNGVQGFFRSFLCFFFFTSPLSGVSKHGDLWKTFHLFSGFKMGHAIIFPRLPCLQPCHYLLSGVKNHRKSESLYFQVFPVFLCLIMAKSKTRKSDENDRFFVFSTSPF